MAAARTAQWTSLMIVAAALAAALLAQGCASGAKDGGKDGAKDGQTKAKPVASGHKPAVRPEVITTTPSHDLLVTGDTVSITSDALREDLSIIANDMGWTIGQAYRQQQKAQLLGKLQQKVAKARPKQFVGGDIGRKPSDLPKLYIKGSADKWIVEAAEDAGLHIQIVQGQPYSQTEAEAVEDRLRAALQEIGFEQFYTFYSLERAKFDIDIEFHPELRLTATQVRKRLPADIAGELIIRMAPDYVGAALRRDVADPKKRPFGPMAVIDSSGGGSLLIPGPGGKVRFTNSCVYVDYKGQKGEAKTNLLAWRAGEVRWDAAGKAILFTSPGKGSPTYKIHNGDHIKYGGQERTDKRVKWLVPPDKSCKGVPFEVDSYSGR